MLMITDNVTKMLIGASITLWGIVTLSGVTNLPLTFLDNQ